jgi:amino acid transporter
MMLGQTRVFYSMAHDGLLPRPFGKIHPRFRTPYISTALTGLCVALAGGLLPLRIVGELVSIGTLLAFVIVSGSVMGMRRLHPEIHRPFRTPLVWVVGPLGMIVCAAQMAGLPGDTWLRLFIWMAIGLYVYFGYGLQHSVLQNQKSAVSQEVTSPADAVPRLGARRRGQLSLGTAVAGLVCFFLPWFQASCGGQTAGRVSGWDLAVGVNMTGERMAGHTYVLLVLLAMLALLLVAGIPFLKGLPLSAAPRALQVIAGGQVAAIPLVELVRASSQAQSQGSAGLISVGTQPAFWGTVLCGAVLTLVGLVGQPERPRQTGGSLPSG